MSADTASKFAAAQIAVPAGFRFASAAAGIKASGKPDVAFVQVEDPLGASAAALFTKNLVQAAPVRLGREHLRASRGRIRAVLVNSGNANCATGAAGIAGARKACSAAAKLLRARPEQVFPSSTGIIGVPLPVEKLLSALPQAVLNAGSNTDAVLAFAQAIMTTDTRPKFSAATFDHRGREVRVLGIAKGAGMIHPDMATMLVYLFTDLAASPQELKKILSAVTDESFHCISVDGDTSTNDTVLLLASGAAQVSLRDAKAGFSNALRKVCQELAEQIVADGEGVQHVIRLVIEGARNRADARQLAQAISTSLLVKTAWAGADPNWGRMLAAAGRAGVRLDSRKVQIFIGGQQVCRNGEAMRFDSAAAHRTMSQAKYEIRLRVGSSATRFVFFTCDLTAEYVHVNAEYST
jgi:glutamate N-acetyltransferase/amino-acid N-acetyltransferase